jgi:hypothetical protein
MSCLEAFHAGKIPPNVPTTNARINPCLTMSAVTAKAKDVWEKEVML